MFFRKDYAVPGPGVDPDAPEKTGLARFAEILSLECVTLFKLNLLFLASCIPVVTIPPAIFAMNSVVRRMVLDQPVECLYHYKTAFRRQWRRGYGAFLLTGVPLLLAACGMWFYLSQAMTQPLFLAPFMFCSTVFFAAALTAPYLYALLEMGRGPRESVRLALVLGLGKPLRAVLAALSILGSLTAAVLALPISAIYLLLIGFSLPCLLGNFFIRTVLRQI